MHTTADIQARFNNISHQTIKRYCDEFRAYISPTARPEEKRPRRFTDADLKVFALIVEMKGQGKVFAEIHAALKAGQRAEPPEPSTHTERETAIVATGNAIVSQLQTRIQDLESELMEERAKRHRAEGREDLLLEMLKDAQERIIKLSIGKGGE